MIKRKLILIFSSVLMLAVIVLLFISLGYYPIAIVNGHFITARAFASAWRAGASYSEQFMKVYQASSSTSASAGIPQTQLQAAVLDQLVEDQLVHDEVRTQLGRDYAYLLENKIGKYRQDAQLRAAAASVFGLDFASFQQQVLVPQAERDLLSGRLFMKGQALDDWISVARKNASVVLLSGSFSWQDGKVRD